jgi:SWI/SNF-related matrix-associated actin-dependent regulator of chromatin subfamily A-like protein 1
MELYSQISNRNKLIFVFQNCRYLFLLTGTPALSRPMELYSQISALVPGLFKYAKEFGFR